MPLALESPAFDAGSVISKRYTHDGDDLSPPLAWSDVPEGTRSFALMLDSAADGKIRNHWIIFNIDGSIRELPQDIPRQDTLQQWTHDGISVKQGRSDFDRVGYTGPLPSTKPPHANTFTLYALDCQLHEPTACSRQDLLAAMAGHILDQAELTVIYTA